MTCQAEVIERLPQLLDITGIFPLSFFFFFYIYAYNHTRLMVHHMAKPHKSFLFSTGLKLNPKTSPGREKNVYFLYHTLGTHDLVTAST